GQVRYYMMVYVDEGYRGTAGPVAVYHYPLAHILSSSYNEANDLTLTFSSTPFYKNFKEYLLYSAYYPHLPQDLYFQSTERTDTVITFPAVGFGNDFETKLIAYPKNYYANVYANYMTVEKVIAGYGTPWGPYPVYNFITRAATDRFYTVHNDRLKIIDANSLQVVQERDITHQQPNEYANTKNAISENGQYMYSLLNGRILRLDPATLQTLDTVKLEEVLPYSFYSNLSIGVSNNNRLMIAGHHYWNFKDTVYVVDMAQKKLLTKKRASTYPAFSAISPDGKALKINYSLFTEQSNGSWQQRLGHTDTEVFNMTFHPSKPWYGMRQDNQVTYYDILTGTLQKTVVTEKPMTEYRIDSKSGYLYGQVDGFMYVYNVSSGQLVRKLKLAQNAATLLYGDKIFSQSRYINL
ncbi:MAG: hypothetical protein LPK14_11350, partial [Hymenobacteraceae bacterium]|nr:hypothetical protein [Hymenobacteraceae bacterium]